MNGLTTSEAAERLGIPKTTLSTWLGQLPIPHETDSRGRRRLDDEALSLLETVKTLRDEDCGYQTIRRRIGPATESGPIADETQPGHVPTFDPSAFVGQVVEAISAQTDLAEKYARAAHQIGRLESDNEHLKAQLAELRDKVAQLEAPKASVRSWWKLWG